MNKIISYVKIIYKLSMQPDMWSHLIRLIRDKTARLISPNLIDLAELKKAESFSGEEWATNMSVPSDVAYAQLGLESYIEEYRSSFSKKIVEISKQHATLTRGLGGPTNCELLYALCESVAAKNVCETGVAAGWSSYVILSSLEKRHGNLFSVDLPYLDSTAGYEAGIVVPKGLRKNWSLYVMADREGISKIFSLGKKFDVVHYDSDKSIAGRLFAYPFLWNMLVSGGYLISDDISDNIAFAYFAKSVGAVPVVVKDGNKFQGIIRKP